MAEQIIFVGFVALLCLSLAAMAYMAIHLDKAKGDILTAFMEIDLLRESLRKESDFSSKQRIEFAQMLHEMHRQIQSLFPGDEEE